MGIAVLLNSLDKPGVEKLHLQLLQHHSEALRTKRVVNMSSGSRARTTSSSSSSSRSSSI